ncbi:unnamed protein product [Nippostrongylus brasiliensis]|uniref:TIL domain-containing protein n=1 Tax=Nippostrongylus brasiliensis TaxID=27835 RepID=A0A158QZX6_NIPBR|nr:unnamed protein product [Nippostrongylus brasiliensis]
MTTRLIVFTALTIVYVNAGPFDCDKDGKCSPGLRCEEGTCVLRTDCPMLSMPRMKSGCKLTMMVDERDCPMPKIECSKENLKCGSIYCEPGYECDKDAVKCIPRRDCPNLVLPKVDGCTDEMTLDEYDCLMPVRTCKPTKPLRQKRAKTTDPSVKCAKNAEYRECTNFCPAKSCSNYLEKSACFSLRCGPPGCMCKEGHVQLSHDIEQGCVSRETCVKLDSLKKNIERNKPAN